MSEWLPIETAPKDTQILLYLPHVNKVRQGSYNSHFHRGRIGWRVCWTPRTISPIAIEPTHWMPLPEPPKE